MHHCLIMSWLISIKKCNQIFESKDEDWRKKKHDYKNLKDLDYQVGKTKKEEKEEEAKKDKADEAGQELPPWIKSNDKFNELRNYT